MTALLNKTQNIRIKLIKMSWQRGNFISERICYTLHLECFSINDCLKNAYLTLSKNPVEYHFESL